MQAANVSDNLPLFQRKFLFLDPTRYLSIMISHYGQPFHSIEVINFIGVLFALIIRLTNFRSIQSLGFLDSYPQYHSTRVLIG